MSRSTLRSLSAALLLSLSVPFLAHAQSAAPAPTAAALPRVQLDEILSSQNRARTLTQVAISPDAKRLVWLEAGQIRFAPFDNLVQSQPVTAVAPSQSCNASNLIWSPDSAAIAFLSDCADPGGQPDLFLSHLDGKSAVRLTELHGYVDAPAFSPDGKSIAFLYVEGATRPSGALAAETPPAGVIGEDHVEIQRVALVPADSSQPTVPTTVTPPSLHVFEFDWSPDSKSLAYVAADPPGENNWWVAKLYTQPVAAAAIAKPPGAPAPGPPRTGLRPGGGDPGPPRTGLRPGGGDPSAAADETWDTTDPKPTAILAPADVAGPLHGLQIAVPRWSPDGKTIAFIGGLMSDQGVTGGDVWLVSSVFGQSTTGPQPSNLTPGRPTSAQWIAWDDDQSLYVAEIAGGDDRLIHLQIPASSGPPATSDSPVFTIPGDVGSGQFDPSLSASADRSLFVFQASTFNTPPEIFAARARQDPFVHSADTARLFQISHFNEGVKPSWGDSVSLSWKNDGFQIQGWLLLPAHYDPAKRYPLLVEVHGGPASSVTSRWNGGAGGFSATAFSALGYFVLLPNPRGSYGQGEAFTQANRKDFGFGDLRDILAGVDTVLSKYPVDPNRVGIAGWSYGGFMAMFAVTQTHRFRAAVAGAGISDWLSYYGENSIDQWMIPYFGASVYDDPQVYARSSAITFIKQAKTPTLTVVGDRDGECPAPQSFEFWHALRDLHIPAQLVVYPNEGHGFSDPADRRDALRRAVDWFTRYMP
jgi:dipeptidyl aminopeptidase/acylaminoacyl peptidase